MTPDGASASPARVLLDRAALVQNWQAMDRLSGAARAGAAVKADGYGLGAREVVRLLAAAGCRDFYVAHWAEAAAIADLVPPGWISVLHGILPGEERVASALGARPVLNSPAQAARWRALGGGGCDVMVDSGMHRLGFAAQDIGAGALDGLSIATLMSHLASADEDREQNGLQRAAFVSLSQAVAHRECSLANSAGIALGGDFAFDVTRPGIALYGGVPRPELADTIRQVARPQARVVQLADLAAGDCVGYNATYAAPRAMRAAILSAGYADGYLRAFSNCGAASFGDAKMPVIGRVSMDLIIVDASEAGALREGDWATIAYELPAAAAATGLSQYELLTGLGARLERVWA